MPTRATEALDSAEDLADTPLEYRRVSADDIQLGLHNLTAATLQLSVVFHRAAFSVDQMQSTRNRFVHQET